MSFKEETGSLTLAHRTQRRERERGGVGEGAAGGEAEVEVTMGQYMCVVRQKIFFQ